MESLDFGISKDGGPENRDPASRTGELVGRLPEIVRIEPGSLSFGLESVTPSGSSEFQDLRPELRAVIFGAAKDCVIFLKKPLILDPFVDHDERREWRKSLDSQTREDVENNKIRGNTIHALTKGFFALRDELRKEGTDAHADVQKLSEICARVPSLTDYSFLTTEEKIKVVKKLEDICHTYLDFIIKHKASTTH